MIAAERETWFFADSVALYEAKGWHEPFKAVYYAGAFNGEGREWFDVFCGAVQTVEPVQHLRLADKEAFFKVADNENALLFLAGGDVERGLQHMWGKELRCGRIAGLSAGAMALCEEWWDEAREESQLGLGFLKELAVCVHDESNEWASAHAQHAATGCDVLCIPSGGAVRIAGLPYARPASLHPLFVDALLLHKGHILTLPKDACFVFSSHYLSSAAP